MSALPRADFPDPLLKASSARRLELWRGFVLRPVVVGPLVIAAGLGAGFVHWILGVVILVAVPIGVLVWANGKAAGEWWLRLLGVLNMTPDDAHVLGLTPLLRSGDERKVLRAGSDGRRRLLVFRSTDISHNSKGEETRQNHDYTVVLYHDAPPSVRFLSAHEHRARWATWLGDDLRGPTIGDVEEFKVESVALHDRFELRAAVADGAITRQIFEPSFMLWFARSGLAFEYEGGDLAVMVDRVLEHSEEFKMLLSRADEIHKAVSRLGTPPAA